MKEITVKDVVVEGSSCNPQRIAKFMNAVRIIRPFIIVPPGCQAFSVMVHWRDSRIDE